MKGLFILKNKWFLACLLWILSALLVNSLVFAQDQQPTVSDDDVNKVASQLYCPICDNVRLDICDTDVCKLWREEIREQLADGKSEEEILTFFADQFGSQVLADPSKENWLFNSVPILIFLSGLAVIIWVYQTRKVNLPLSESESKNDIEIKGGGQL
jgi:cytochrome c-type biogenesis protein CcmH